MSHLRNNPHYPAARQTHRKTSQLPRVKARAVSMYRLECYSAQQDNLAGSLKYEIAAIFNASAIVG